MERRTLGKGGPTEVSAGRADSPIDLGVIRLKGR